MKRSTKLLIVLLIVVLVAPIIYISVVVSKLPSFKDWVVETVESLDTENQNLYEYKMTVTSSQQLPDCYMYITTYRGKVDSLHSVNFVAPVEGVQAELRGDSIIVNLDNLKAVDSDALLLTVELPEKNNLKLDNQVANVDIRFNNMDIGAVNVTSQGDLIIEDCDMGAFMSVECDARKRLSIDDSNIGAARLDGKGTTLTVSDSNLGAMSIAGTCDAITLGDSNIGVMVWNDECNDKAVVTDCTMTVKVKENDVNATWDEEKEDSSVKTYIIDEDGAKVDISLNEMKVNGSDGEKVDISPTGVFVDDGETTVKITPTGIVVKENGEDIVNIGLNGITVKE